MFADGYLNLNSRDNKTKQTGKRKQDCIHEPWSIIRRKNRDLNYILRPVFIVLNDLASLIGNTFNYRFVFMHSAVWINIFF